MFSGVLSQAATKFSGSQVKTYSPRETRGIEAAKHSDVSVEGHRILACVASVSIAKIGPDSNQRELGVNHTCSGERKEERSGERSPKIGGECRVARAPAPVAQMASGFSPIVCFRKKFSGRRPQMLQIFAASALCSTDLSFFWLQTKMGIPGCRQTSSVMQICCSGSEETPKFKYSLACFKSI